MGATEPAPQGRGAAGGDDGEAGDLDSAPDAFALDSDAEVRAHWGCMVHGVAMPLPPGLTAVAARRPRAPRGFLCPQGSSGTDPGESDADGDDGEAAPAKPARQGGGPAASAAAGDFSGKTRKQLCAWAKANGLVGVSGTAVAELRKVCEEAAAAQRDGGHARRTWADGRVHGPPPAFQAGVAAQGFRGPAKEAKRKQKLGTATFATFFFCFFTPDMLGVWAARACVGSGKQRGGRAAARIRKNLRSRRAPPRSPRRHADQPARPDAQCGAGLRACDDCGADRVAWDAHSHERARPWPRRRARHVERGV